MAQDSHSDLFLRMVQNNKLIDGECRVELAPRGTVPNDLTTGFVPFKMFQIEKFALAAGAQSPPSTTPPVPGQKPPLAKSPHGHLSGAPGYPAELQSIKISRTVDIGSIRLFQSVIDSSDYDSVSVVKRRSTGVKFGGEVFLRLDFNHVLVTTINWSDGDEIEESFEFICRSLTIRYKPALPNVLGTTITRFWGMTGEKEFDLKAAPLS